jgi:hypothetical protein
MNTKINGSLNLASLKALGAKLEKIRQVEAKHAAFAVILVVSLVYLFMIISIGHLATADPSPDAAAKAETSDEVPRIDPKAIQQILQLEQNNTQVHSLFNQARNNPFQE